MKTDQYTINYNLKNGLWKSKEISNPFLKTHNDNLLI